jgi:hypothetical protein
MHTGRSILTPTPNFYRQINVTIAIQDFQKKQIGKVMENSVSILAE